MKKIDIILKMVNDFFNNEKIIISHIEKFILGHKRIISIKLVLNFNTDDLYIKMDKLASKLRQILPSAIINYTIAYRNFSISYYI